MSFNPLVPPQDGTHNGPHRGMRMVLQCTPATPENECNVYIYTQDNFLLQTFPYMIIRNCHGGAMNSWGVHVVPMFFTYKWEHPHTDTCHQWKFRYAYGNAPMQLYCTSPTLWTAAWGTPGVQCDPLPPFPKFHRVRVFGTDPNGLDHWIVGLKQYKIDAF